MTDPVITATLITLLVVSASKLLMKIFTRIKSSNCMGAEVQFTDTKDKKDSDESVQLP